MRSQSAVPMLPDEKKAYNRYNDPYASSYHGKCFAVVTILNMQWHELQKNILAGYKEVVCTKGEFPLKVFEFSCCTNMEIICYLTWHMV